MWKRTFCITDFGSFGLVSFHGSNYNIKKRLSAHQVTRLCRSGLFYPISSSWYINMTKISEIEDGFIYFGSKGPEAKRVPISRWKAHHLRGQLARLGSH